MLESVGAVLRKVPTRGIGDLAIFPGKDGQPVSCDTCQVWLRRAKARLLAAAPYADREAVRKRLEQGSKSRQDAGRLRWIARFAAFAIRTSP
jgi:hypothetical protein